MNVKTFCDTEKNKFSEDFFVLEQGGHIFE